MHSKSSEYLNMTSSSQNKISNIYSSIFSILILLLLGSFLPLPSVDLSTISTDFRWREELIELYSMIRFSMGDRIFNNVLVGENGWLFLTEDGSITDYQNIDPLNNKKLANFQVKLNQLSSELKRQGATLLVVFPPNKSTIYGEYMPTQIPTIGQKSRLDQFVEYMETNGGSVPIIDLRHTLNEASQFNDVYYQTDTHWNDLGAYYGYVEIMQALMVNYPFLQPHPISDFNYSRANASVHDLPLLMGLSDYEEENWVLTPRFEVQLEEEKTVLPDGRYIRTVINAEPHLPRLLVFSDSFYVGLAHFVEPHFGRIKTIPFTYEDNIWSLDWIQLERPDIVIIEVAERYIDVSLPRLLEN